MDVGITMPDDFWDSILPPFLCPRGLALFRLLCKKYHKKYSEFIVPMAIGRRVNMYWNSPKRFYNFRACWAALDQLKCWGQMALLPAGWQMVDDAHSLYEQTNLIWCAEETVHGNVKRHMVVLRLVHYLSEVHWELHMSLRMSFEFVEKRFKLPLNAATRLDIRSCICDPDKRHLIAKRMLKPDS